MSPKRYEVLVRIPLEATSLRAAAILGRTRLIELLAAAEGAELELEVWRITRTGAHHADERRFAGRREARGVPGEVRALNAAAKARRAAEAFVRLIGTHKVEEGAG